MFSTPLNIIVAIPGVCFELRHECASRICETMKLNLSTSHKSAYCIYEMNLSLKVRDVKSLMERKYIKMMLNMMNS